MGRPELTNRMYRRSRQRDLTGLVRDLGQDETGVRRLREERKKTRVDRDKVSEVVPTTRISTSFNFSTMRLTTTNDLTSCFGEILIEIQG